MRTTVPENAELGKIIGGKLASSSGPTTLALPLAGVSQLDVAGEVFHDPAADAALFDALQEHIDESVAVLERETDINDAAFAEAMVDKIDSYMQATGNGPEG